RYAHVVTERRYRTRGQTILGKRGAQADSCLILVVPLLRCNPGVLLLDCSSAGNALLIPGLPSNVSRRCHQVAIKSDCFAPLHARSWRAYLGASHFAGARVVQYFLVPSEFLPAPSEFLPVRSIPRDFAVLAVHPRGAGNRAN